MLFNYEMFDCWEIEYQVKHPNQIYFKFVHPGQLCLPVHVVIVDYCLFLTYWTGVRGWDKTHCTLAKVRKAGCISEQFFQLLLACL